MMNGGINLPTLGECAMPYPYSHNNFIIHTSCNNNTGNAVQVIY